MNEKTFVGKVKDRWIVVTSVLGAIATIGAILTFSFSVDERFAHAEELKVVKDSFYQQQQAQNKINASIILRFEALDDSQRIADLQERIRDIKSHYIKEDLSIPYQMQQEIDFLQNEIDALMTPKRVGK
jgi:hypothetical protein